MGLFFNLAKAFDCVHHNILMWKFQKYEHHGIPIKWINGYHTKREQYVSIHEKEFESNKLLVGQRVPQEGVLSLTFPMSFY